MIRAADVANLTLLNEIVERPQRFLDRHARVGLVTHVEIDVVGSQPAQARLARLNQVLAREPDVVRPCPQPHVGFGDQDEVLAAARQRLAENLLRASERVDVGGVESS